MILGIDEVGRGCWAGPLVMGAVVLGESKVEGLTDSKVLTKKRRAELALEINDKALAAGLGWVEAREIDELGLSRSLRLACRRAVEQIKAPHSEIIIDGTVNFLAGTGKEPFSSTLAKADLLIPAVSAASIVAKEARDLYMRQQAEIYPGYGFEEHVGYGTAKHRLAIEKNGPCELHRLSFAPLRKYADIKAETVSEDTLTTKKIGDAAENVVASELQSRGHEIIARNWRTKFCEIDIVSVLDNTVYFTEVKYRKSSEYGDGLEAITAKKQRQIKFAAEVFLTKYKQFKDFNVALLAADASDDPVVINNIIEIN